MHSKTSMRTPLARVRGLGSAKSGTEHFWLLRITSVALLALTVTFIGTLIALFGKSYAQAMAILSNPLVAVLLLLFVVTSLVHTRAGMQTIIEDYVHDEGLKVLALMGNTFFIVLVGAASAFAILKIAFVGA